MEITLQKNGLAKTMKTGFSIEYLFFGILYPIYKGDYKGVFKQLLILFLSCGLAIFVFPFTYNKAYIKRLLMKGYQPVDERSERWLSHNLNYYL